MMHIFHQKCGSRSAHSGAGLGSLREPMLLCEDLTDYLGPLLWVILISVIECRQYARYQVGHPSTA